MVSTIKNNFSEPGITSRQYECEQDLVSMQEMLMQGRMQTGDWHYAHVGDLMFNFFMIARHLNPYDFIRLWYDGNKLVGYAMLGEDPSFDFHILPDYEWQGIEEQALAWAETRLGALYEEEPVRWSVNLVSGSRQDNARRITFLEQHGFRQGGEFSEVNMMHRLEGDSAEPVIPDGYQVRAVAATGDLSTRAAVQREVWHPWTVGNVSDEDYAWFMRLPAYDRQLDIVAFTPDGVAVAYVNGWLDPVNNVGDFGPVGALPEYRRKGLTRAVLLECLRRMQASGMSRVSVSTGVNNIAAIKLYESVGFRIENKYFEYIRPGN